MARKQKSGRWMNAAVTVFLMLLCSAALGMLFGYIGSDVGARISRINPTGIGDIVGAFVGFILGYPLGAYAGVLLVGRWRAKEGSWLRALIGGVVGFVAMLIVAEPLHLNLYPQALSLAFVTIFPVCISVGWLLKKK